MVDDLIESDSQSSREKQNTRWILEALEFDGMNSRKRTVEEAMGDTFRWCVTDDRVPEDHPKLAMSFKTWMSDGYGIFHITGKPGSGKSTLMKLIDDSDESHQHLLRWAFRHDHRLIRARFYAWRAADRNRLQNQKEGLLRTLLHQILSEAPEFAKETFPRYWVPEKFSRLNKWSNNSPDNHKLELGLHDILGGLKSILTTTREVSFFILIDGMDEFRDEIEQWEIAKELFSWTENKRQNIKVCASSREENAFMDTFSISQRLRLHVVTEKDIRRLVLTRIKNIDHFSSASSEDQQALIHCLVNRAEGVFLWVVLVLQELELLSKEGQSVKELVASTECFPNDLSAFLQDVLDRIPKRHRVEAAAIFSVAVSIHHHAPRFLNFEVLHYSMINECIVSSNRSTQSKMTRGKAVKLRDQFILRFPSLCKGLLEIETDFGMGIFGLGEENFDLIPDHAQIPVFTHRSVYDFFQDQPAILSAIAPNSNFKVKDLILRSKIKVAEVLPWSIDVSYCHQIALAQQMRYFLETETDPSCASMFLNLRLLEAVFLRKQNVVLHHAQFDTSLGPKDIRFLPETALLVLIQAAGLNNKLYVEWALQNYPPCFRSSESRAWIAQGLTRSRAVGFPQAILTLVRTGWVSMNEEPRVDGILDPDSLPPLPTSAWPNLVISILGHGMYFRDKRCIPILDSWAQLIYSCLEMGAEPRIRFWWWSQEMCADCDNKISREGDDSRPNNEGLYKKEGPAHSNASPGQVTSSWRPTANPVFSRPRRGISMTLGDDAQCERRVPEILRTGEEPGYCLPCALVTTFGQASGSATLRDVLERVSTPALDKMLPDTRFVGSYEGETPRILRSNKLREKMLKTLDKALKMSQPQCGANSYQEERRTVSTDNDEFPANSPISNRLDRQWERYQWFFFGCLGKQRACFFSKYLMKRILLTKFPKGLF